MSTSTTERTYTIKDAAALTGLPASTLRYYETVGVIAPISRGASSKHRVYDEDDLGQLMGIACLAATGMSVNDMRQYVANAPRGAAAATEQIALLEAQEQRLAVEARQIVLRKRYVQIKIDYWNAVEAGSTDLAQQLSSDARTCADGLRRAAEDH